MTRRITFAIVATALVTLLIAGLGTLLLSRIGARQQTEDDLRAQAEATATLLRIRTGTTAAGGGPVVTRETLARIRSLLDLEDFDLVILDPQDQVALDLGDPLPERVTLERLDPAALRAGETVSGGAGPSRVFAAAPLTPQRNFLGVVVLTRPVEPWIGSSARWFALAASVSIGIAALVAWRLGRQLTAPLRRATGATAAIAAGDLSTRVPSRTSGRADELDQLGTAINDMAAALERSQGLERQFLLSVSHDLRTPLTSIRGYAEAIAEGATPDPAAASEVILQEARRLERLVRDLLDLAKLEARTFSFELGPTDLGGLVGAAVAGVQQEAARRELLVTTSLPDTPVRAVADPDRLAQVLGNLLDNAMRFAATGVEVGAAAHEGAAVLWVRDDGPGIDPADLPHVFERLYVARHVPEGKETGSGLGLAIVRELVAAMGGQVRAEAAPGGGTQLVVTLPPA